MEEFLVQMDFRIPVEWSPAEREALRQREAAASNDLWDEHRFVRVWRVPGKTAAICLCRAENVTALHDMLRGLPYAQAGIMDFTVSPLADHPTEREARERAAAGAEGAKRHPW